MSRLLFFLSRAVLVYLRNWQARLDERDATEVRGKNKQDSGSTLWIFIQCIWYPDWAHRRGKDTRSEPRQQLSLWATWHTVCLPPELFQSWQHDFIVNTVTCRHVVQAAWGLQHARGAEMLVNRTTLRQMCPEITLFFVEDCVGYRSLNCWMLGQKFRPCQQTNVTTRARHEMLSKNSDSPVLACTSAAFVD